MDLLRQRARRLRNGGTDAERQLWRFLRGRQLEGFRFRRQVPLAGFIADFVCPQARLVIELDGGQHGDAHARIHDEARTEKLQALGYRVVRYWNDDVLLSTDDVVADIYRHLTAGFARHCGVACGSESTPPQPSPSLREREGAGAADAPRVTTEAGFSALQPGSRDAPSLSPEAKGRGRKGCS